MLGGSSPPPLCPGCSHSTPILTLCQPLGSTGGLPGRWSVVKYEYSPRPNCLGCPACSTVTIGTKTLLLGVVQRIRSILECDLSETGGPGTEGLHTPQTLPVQPPSGSGQSPGRLARDHGPAGFLHSMVLLELCCTQNIKTSGWLECISLVMSF